MIFSYLIEMKHTLLTKELWKGELSAVMIAENMRKEKRFAHIERFADRLCLASPVMYGEELEYVAKACENHDISSTGENIDELEKMAADYIGTKYAVALANGTAALHLAMKLAAEQLYGSSSGVSTPYGLGAGGALCGKRVFCSDFTAGAAVQPILYEGGEPIFIDASMEDWNMDPEILEKAFKKYPDVKLVVCTHLYGFPGRIDEIKRICEKHGAMLIEDAAESLGAKYKGKQTGSFGDYGVLSFGGNKIISGGSGGMLLVNDRYSAEKARKWSAQSRENVPWNQHEELGYNYGMSNVTAGIVRGQWGHIEEHITAKKRIYERYEKRLECLEVVMNPYDDRYSIPSYWLSCMMIEGNGLCRTARGGAEYIYQTDHGRTCPGEVLDALNAFNIEAQPVWKPMHMQPLYRNHEFFDVDGGRRSFRDFYIRKLVRADQGRYIFDRGVCLPSHTGMTEEQQERVIEIICGCYQ